MGNWTDTSWMWNLRINEELSSLEGRQQLIDLKSVMQNIILSQSELDTFLWWKDPNEFSIKSCYQWLFYLINADKTMSSICQQVLNDIWKLKEAEKLLVFGWKVMHNILQTRMKLNRRHVIGETCCPHYFVEDETCIYLSYHCPVGKALWGMVLAWLEVHSS